MVIVSDKPLPVAELIGRVPCDQAGSVVIHLGVVKAEPDGKKSAGINFSVIGDLEAEMRLLEADLRSQFKIAEVLLARRIGRLSVGEVILVAAIAAPGREAAFAACREAVERFKTMKSIRKEELLIP